MIYFIFFTYIHVKALSPGPSSGGETVCDAISHGEQEIPNFGKKRRIKTKKQNNMCHLTRLHTSISNGYFLPLTWLLVALRSLFLSYQLDNK